MDGGAKEPEMPFTPDPTRIPSYSQLWGTFTAACGYPGCNWTKKFQFSNGMKLEVGDTLPSGEDPNFDTCMKCKRKMLKVTSVPVQTSQTQSVGFWKVPTE